ncbi:MAG: hypothetical protein SR1Q7_02755 [Quinella sp. 1Q7]|nr:hypothetical protein [Quinella sp. 1Q7]
MRNDSLDVLVVAFNVKFPRRQNFSICALSCSAETSATTIKIIASTVAKNFFMPQLPAYFTKTTAQLFKNLSC